MAQAFFIFFVIKRITWTSLDTNLGCLTQRTSLEFSTFGEVEEKNVRLVFDVFVDSTFAAFVVGWGEKFVSITIGVSWKIDEEKMLIRVIIFYTNERFESGNYRK